MPLSFRRHLSPLRPVYASLALIAFSGCETDRPRRGAMAAPEAGTAAPQASPEMAAHGLFFNGQLEAEVLLSRVGFGPRDKVSSEPHTLEGAHLGGFGIGGSRRGGGGVPPDGGGRGPGGRGGDGEPTPRIVASNQPPVRLHLRLTNRSNDTVQVEVLDFSSDLGNFVVQPRHLALVPAQSAEVDPMTSRLGVTSDALQIAVRIRLNGKTEQQGLSLEKIVPPTTPTPATP